MSNSKKILVIALIAFFLLATGLSAIGAYAVVFESNTQLQTQDATWIFASTTNYTSGDLIVGNDYVTFPSGDTLRLVPASGSVSISIIDTTGVNSNTFYIVGSNQSVTYFFTLANGSLATMNYSGTLFNTSFVASSDSTGWNYTFVPTISSGDTGGGGGGGGSPDVITGGNNTTTSTPVVPLSKPEIDYLFGIIPVPTIDSLGNEAQKAYIDGGILINANRAIFAGITFIIIAGFILFIVISDKDDKKKNTGRQGGDEE